MIDPKFIGFRPAARSATVERGRLRFFAKATGQTDPIYSDLKAAQAAGHTDLPAPPTFVIALAMEVDNPFETYEMMGVDMGKVLHAAQNFHYHRVIIAGEVLTFQDRIDNIFAKKDGALEFLIIKTDVTDPAGELVAEMSATIVVRYT